MKKLLYIFLLLTTTANGQILCNGWRYVTGGSFPPASSYGYWEADANVTQVSNAISAWGDVATNTKSFAQATGANKPTWNATEIAFSNAGPAFLSMTGSFSAPYSIYVVAKMSSTSGLNVAFSSGGTCCGGAYIKMSGGNVIGSSDGGSNEMSTSFGSINTYRGYGLIYNGASSKIYVNTTLTTGNMGSGNAATTLKIGYTSAIGGPTITMEAIYILTSPAAGDDAIVKAHILSKYGITM